jgi:hypothetical protein
MQVVREVQAGEALNDIVLEMKDYTYNSGMETALVELSDGTRAIVIGGQNGIDFAEGQISRLFLHLHPYDLPASGPSDADRNALSVLGQISSWLLEHGLLTKFTRK